MPMRYTKTPLQMRLEAERGPRRPSPPPGPVVPSSRPPLASAEEENAYLDACADWLAHVRAGRIEVR